MAETITCTGDDRPNVWSQSGYAASPSIVCTFGESDFVKIGNGFLEAYLGDGDAAAQAFDGGNLLGDAGNDSWVFHAIHGNSLA